MSPHQPHRILIEQAVFLTAAMVLKDPPPRSSIRLPSITEASELKKKLQWALSRPSRASERWRL